jgi:hypothetical protein
VLVRVLAGVEDDGFLQARAEPFFQQAEAAEAFAADAGACLDLERDDLAVVAFKYEVYLVAGLCPEVAGCYRCV